MTPIDSVDEIENFAEELERIADALPHGESLECPPECRWAIRTAKVLRSIADEMRSSRNRASSAEGLAIQVEAKNAELTEQLDAARKRHAVLRSALSCAHVNLTEQTIAAGDLVKILQADAELRQALPFAERLADQSRAAAEAKFGTAFPAAVVEGSQDPQVQR